MWSMTAYNCGEGLGEAHLVRFRQPSACLRHHGQVGNEQVADDALEQRGGGDEQVLDDELLGETIDTARAGRRTL
jgi:hypothetical protein